MEKSPPWETDRPTCSVCQWIPRLLWNPNTLRHFQNNSPLVPILSHTDVVHTQDLQTNVPAASIISNSAFCIYVFRMILTVDSDYLLKQR
jgi:hypothetical protein